MTLASKLTAREWCLAMHIRHATQATEWLWHANRSGRVSYSIRQMRRAFARDSAKAARSYFKMYQMHSA